MGGDVMGGPLMGGDVMVINHIYILIFGALSILCISRGVRDLNYITEFVIAPRGVKVIATRCVEIQNDITENNVREQNSARGRYGR